MNSNEKNYISGISKAFRAKSNAVRAAGAKAYMRNQFEYYGISSPDRREIQKRFIEENGLPEYENAIEIVRELWKKPERELHYFAMELLHRYKKEYREEDIELIEFLITNNSWWDTVDFIAPKVFRDWTLQYPKQTAKVCREWNKSKNLWLIRSSIIFQLHKKKEFSEELLFDMISRQLHHKDFFIRKAIGWALRQYAKSNPVAVKKFVLHHASELSPLSYREAMKNS